MTKKEKIASLKSAMTTSKREGEEESFYHFTNTAPKELIELFVENYSVKDLDYEIFSRACDIVSEVYSYKPEATDEQATDDIYEHSSESASVYTNGRLEYLNQWNEEEISQTMREYGEQSIAIACAIWYDRQVEQAAIIIKDWVNAEVGSIRKSYCKDAGEEVEQELQSNGEWLCLHK